MSRYTEAITRLRREVCRLKKHYGQSWEWVVDNDPQYARWVVDNVEDLDDEIREALEATL